MESGGLTHLLIIADYYSQNDDYIKCRKKMQRTIFLYHERIIQQISCIFVIA
ncbi:hypothetical protein M120_2258 [Bacteroides fragilis str. 3783N1-8]|nr:hypothetical protein M120_2258 [Bacteroides fragilis str. 3783N1-8]